MYILLLTVVNSRYVTGYVPFSDMKKNQWSFGAITAPGTNILGRIMNGIDVINVSWYC
jgi:hypothetical protein